MLSSIAISMQRYMTPPVFGHVAIKIVIIVISPILRKSETLRRAASLGLHQICHLCKRSLDCTRRLKWPSVGALYPAISRIAFTNLANSLRVVTFCVWKRSCRAVRMSHVKSFKAIFSLRLNSQLAQCKLHNSSTLTTREYLGEKRLFENIGEMFLAASRTFSQLALVPSLPLAEANEMRESQRHIAETISQPAYVTASRAPTVRPRTYTTRKSNQPERASDISNLS